MPWGFVAGAAIGAIGSMASADTQASGQKAAANTQQQMFNTINQQEQPFIQGGYGAENALLYGLGIGGGQSAQGVPLNQVAAAPQSGPYYGFGISGPSGTPGMTYGIGPGGAITRQLAPTGGAPGGSSAGAPLNQAGQPGFGQGYFTQQFTPQDFLNNLDPGYQFQLQTGGQAIRNADTPGVGALSGPALKDLMSFNQGLAGTAYQNAFNRFTTQQNNIFGRLSQIAGLGQSAATQVGNAGTSLGTGIAQAQAGAAASQAGGIVGATNAIGGSAIPLSYFLSQQGGGGGGYGGTIGSLSSGDQAAYGSMLFGGGS